MYENNPFEQYTTILKALSDEKRLKILWLLCTIDSKICVAEVMDVLGETQYNVYRHLKVLEDAGLIYKKKEGEWTFYYYRPAEDTFGEYVKAAIASIPTNLMEQETIRCKHHLGLRVDGKCIVSQRKTGY